MVKLAGRIIVHDWNISQSVVTGYLGISKDRVICLRNWRLDAYFDIFMVELQSTWINADKGFEFWQWSDLIFSLAYRVDETFVPKPLFRHREAESAHVFEKSRARFYAHPLQRSLADEGVDGKTSEDIFRFFFGRLLLSFLPHLERASPPIECHNEVDSHDVKRRLNLNVW